MRREHRLAVAGAALAGSLVGVVLLTSVSSATEGPLASAFSRLGNTISVLEGRLAQKMRGPGRSLRLAWFERDRGDPARMRVPPVVLLGAYDDRMPRSLDGLLGLEDALGITFPLLHSFSAWGDRPDQQFPLRSVSLAWESGSVPVITWEPWLTDFEEARHPHLPGRSGREAGALASVARGDYDFYVDAWARDAARFGRPLFVRFAHEMNDPYRYPWGPPRSSPEDFVAAWRHVVARFREAGASNVIWIWSPHPAYEPWDPYYPGDAWVDWVGTTVLNFGTVARWSHWWSFEDIYGSRHEQLASYGKPIMIGELGSLAVGGDRQAWFREALTGLPSRYPAVKAVILFHAERDQTVTYQALDWTVAGEPALARAIAVAVRGWRGHPSLESVRPH